MLSLIGNILCMNNDFFYNLQSRILGLNTSKFQSPPMKAMSPKLRVEGALIMHSV